MSFITKDQLNLYLQSVSNQSASPGPNNGTTRTRSNLTGPRPPTFRSNTKASSQRLFQDGPTTPTNHQSTLPSQQQQSHARAALSLPSPVTPTSTPIDGALKGLSLSSNSNSSGARSASPILESMGEIEPVLESMGRDDDYDPPGNMMQQQHGMAQFQHYGTMHGYHQHQQQNQGYRHAHGQTWSTPGHGMGPHPYPGANGNHPIPSQFYQNHHDPHSVHLSQEQYRRLQEQQLQQQLQNQDHLRQQHVTHAASHGYHPVPSPAGSQIQPASTHMAAPTPFKTITPRIVPIVDIPKYTTFTPPKTEVVEQILDDDSDKDDWVPEPPPRNPPKKSGSPPVSSATVSTSTPVNKRLPSRPHTPIEAALLERPSTPRVDSGRGSESRATLSSPASSFTSSDEIFAKETDDDRVPLPPPREFRRKSAVSPSRSPTTPSVVALSSDGIFRPNLATSNSSLPSTPSIASKSKAGALVPGTVRANSAKFNAWAAGDASVNANANVSAKREGGIGNTSPNSSRSNSSKTSMVSTTTDSASSVSTGPQRTTKNNTTESFDQNTFSKRAGVTAAATGSGGATSVYSRRKPVPKIPSEAYVNKDLPPIKPKTPSPPSPTLPTRDVIVVGNQHSHSPNKTSSSPPPSLTNAEYDMGHDSKCIVGTEDQAGVVPMADVLSMEAVMDERDLVPTLNNITGPEAGAKTKDAGMDRSGSPSTNPSRNGSCGSNKECRGGGSGLSSEFICAGCDEPISGLLITAMGKRWHAEHFVCTICSTSLEHVQFFHKDGLPYCHLDYHDKFSPKCGHCHSPIENECLTALGKNWHPGHFFCRECGDPFEEDGYMVHDDQPYCEKDYLRLFAPKCAACQGPIQGDFVSALKGKWHKDCFGCTICHVGFDSSSYFVESGKPYCHTHYKTAVATSAS